jgi:hypothetical protein
MTTTLLDTPVPAATCPVSDRLARLRGELLADGWSAEPRPLTEDERRMLVEDYGTEGI